MKASDFISGWLRPVIGDEAATNWTNDELLPKICSGIRVLQGDHPECRRLATGKVADVYAGTLAADDDIPLGEGFLTPLAEYVAARLFEADSDDDRDLKQAALHQDLYVGFFRPQDGGR